mmetsp:Transcript_1679/g.2399  ORF Transcript_1679/g.2399 Transcript_1679/m.2399 type:complete len:292 (-) Transcript_1679:1658-2533(-)|eukprot:CAMPEP_0184869892 /NCGR_PEP_ID=MMETSP0580-20130426/35711_1 /TAXON_ID=1118495 /ORGANISM="Dactyliosolen fragilissimus" /LENGTH=291 /DNA_ID=CAMNT_0027371687 /DNA_START=52 /DNA_END=927 /DNA_ORIENTATION=+
MDDLNSTLAALDAPALQTPARRDGPQDRAEFSSLCLKRKGANAICIARNCSVNHRGDGSSAPIKPGQGFIMKDRFSVFAEPSLHLNLTECKVIDQWSKATLSLVDWKQMFNSITNTAREIKDELDADDDFKVSWDKLYEQMEFKIKSELWKTPKAVKRKANGFGQDDIKLREYKRFFSADDLNAAPAPGKISSFVTKNREVLIDFEARIADLSAAIKKICDLRNTHSAFTAQLATSVDVKIDAIMEMIGIRKKDLSSDYDGSDIWSVLFNISKHLTSLANDINSENGLSKN